MPAKAQVAVHYGLLVGTIFVYSLLSLSVTLPITSSPLAQSLLLLGWLGLGGLAFLLTLIFRKDRRLWFDRISGTWCISTYSLRARA